jgi:hypothetical protein
VHHAKISRLKIKSFLKFVSAVHISAYSAIIRCVEIRGNWCAFRATAIRAFVFTVFLNEVSSFSLCATCVSYAYISILNATYYLATLLPHYMFRPYMPSSGVAYLAKIVAQYVKVIYRV